jgi:hypothetical protein
MNFVIVLTRCFKSIENKILRKKHILYVVSVWKDNWVSSTQKYSVPEAGRTASVLAAIFTAKYWQLLAALMISPHGLLCSPAWVARRSQEALQWATNIWPWKEWPIVKLSPPTGTKMTQKYLTWLWRKIFQVGRNNFKKLINWTRISSSKQKVFKTLMNFYKF